jgi:hypothetical protein
MQGHTDVLGRLNMLPDGAFNCSSVPQPQWANLAAFTIDGTYIRVEIEGDNDATYENNRWTVFLPGGVRVVHNPDHLAHPGEGWLQRIIDRNSNYIDVIESPSDSGYSGHRTTTLVDIFGRQVVIEYLHSADEDWIHSQGTNGAGLVTKVLWKTITVRKTYLWCPTNCTGNAYHTIANSLRVVDKITLPEPVDDLFYEFDYNADATSNPSIGWGEVSKVVLPSGAYSTYDYKADNSTMGIISKEILENSPTQKTLTYLNEYDGSSTPVTDTWTYSGTGSTIETPTFGNYSITAPDGSVSTEYYGGWDGTNNQSPSKYNEGFFKPYKSVSGDGTVVESVYANNIPAEDSLIASANQFVKFQMTSIPDATGSLLKTAIKEFSQDKNGNTTEIREYDFVPYSGTGSVPRDSNGNPTGLPSGLTPLRITKTEFYNPTPDSASTTYTDTDAYQYSSSSVLRALPKSVEVQDGSGTPKSRSEIAYDYTAYSTNTIGGNLIESKAWDSYKGGAARAYSNPLTSTNSISTSVTYNGYGMPLTSTDASGVVSQITYGNVTGPGGLVSDLYPTQTVSADMATGTSTQREAARPRWAAAHRRSAIQPFPPVPTG